MPEKLRWENPGQKQQIRPENPGLLVPEKVRPENPGKKLQIRQENSAASNYRNGRKIPRRNTMNAIALSTQGGSGAMVEYLLPNLKVEGCSRPPCAQIFFRYTAGKFRWRRKLNRKFRPKCQKLFCSIYEMSQRHPVWVAENHVKPCNSVFLLFH
jgi:hypothetical protein